MKQCSPKPVLVQLSERGSERAGYNGALATPNRSRPVPDRSEFAELLLNAFLWQLFAVTLPGHEGGRVSNLIIVDELDEKRRTAVRAADWKTIGGVTPGSKQPWLALKAVGGN